MLNLFKKKIPYKPIDELPIGKIVILWVDSYDCGWTADIGWKIEDDKFILSVTGKESHMVYDMYQELDYPEDKPVEEILK